MSEEVNEVLHHEVSLKLLLSMGQEKVFAEQMLSAVVEVLTLTMGWQREIFTSKEASEVLHHELLLKLSLSLGQEVCDQRSSLMSCCWSYHSLWDKRKPSHQKRCVIRGPHSSAVAGLFTYTYHWIRQEEVFALEEVSDHQLPLRFSLSR